MTLIKQEKLVFVLVILYIQKYLYWGVVAERSSLPDYLCVFTKLLTGTRVSEDFQFRACPPKNVLSIVPMLYLPYKKRELCAVFIL